jgi:predicted RNA-binding Zn-ribbon protein involved in translation (DUF1610 family)
MEKLIALKVKCPKCKKSLMDPYHNINGKPSIAIDIEVKGEKGKMMLCSYYGCYEHKSTIELPENEIITFFCPNCNEKLISKNVCEECNAPMIPLSFEKGGRLYICSRLGCTKHYLNFENVSDALRKMYNEFGYF